MSILEGLTNLVNLILEGVSKPKRLITFLFFFFILSLTLLYIENHTRIVYHFSLERKIVLLNQLNNLAKEDVILNKELSPIYFEVSQELLKRKVTPMEFPSITILVFYKFLTGAFLGLLFLLIALFYRRPKAMQGALIISLFFGIIAMFVPILFGSIWYNFIALMIGQLLILLALSPKKDSHNTPHVA
jgi:hypothetical protein